MTMIIDFPDDLVRELELRARDRGQDLPQAVTELLRIALRRSGSDEPAAPTAFKIDEKTGLPYIECEYAATDMTPQRVAEILLDQEVAWHNEAR